MRNEDENPATQLDYEETARGFALIKFKDSRRVECSLQETRSADGPAIWLGINKADPRIMASMATRLGVDPGEGKGFIPYPLPKAVLISTRMHLNQAEVKALLPVLQHFADTGEVSLVLPTSNQQPDQGVIMTFPKPTLNFSIDNGDTWQPAPQGVRVQYEGLNLTIDEQEVSGLLNVNHTSEGMIFDLYGHESEGQRQLQGTRALMVDDLAEFVIQIDTSDVE